MVDHEPPLNVGSAVALILALAGGISVVVLSVAFAVRGTSATTGGTVLATALGAVLGAVISWLARYQGGSPIPPPPTPPPVYVIHHEKGDTP